MKIALIGNIQPVSIHSVLIGLALELNQRHQVCIISPPCDDRKTRSGDLKNIPLVFIGSKKVKFWLWNNLVTFFQMSLFLKKNRFDIVHIHLGGLRHYLAWVLPLCLFKIPFGTTIHAPIPDYKEKSCPWGVKWQRYIVQQSIGLYLFRPSKFITAVSARLALDINNRYGRNWDIRPLPIGIPTDLLFSAPGNGLPHPPRKPYILAFVSGDVPKLKGADLLLMAFREVSQKNEMISLVLCGPNTARFQPIAKIMKIENRLFLYDQLEHQHAMRLLNDCLFYVQPSRNEGFSLSVVEAIALLKAVLVTDQIGVLDYDYLKHGCHVHVVPGMDVAALSEGMLFLLNNGSYRTRLAQQGNAAIAQLSWGVLAPAYENLYSETLLSNRPGSRG